MHIRQVRMGPFKSSQIKSNQVKSKHEEMSSSKPLLGKPSGDDHRRSLQQTLTGLVSGDAVLPMLPRRHSPGIVQACPMLLDSSLQFLAPFHAVLPPGQCMLPSIVPQKHQLN